MPNPRAKIKEQHTPRKGLGQNFLTDSNVLQRIVRAAEIAREDVVLEIGPGLGHLTRVLAETGARVVAVEFDRDLVKTLEGELAELPNVLLRQGDVLKRAPEEWLADAGLAPPYLVVANIPYYITSAILRYLLEAEPPPRRIVVLTQKEVAQQLTAKPPHATLLGTSVQYYGSPRVVHIVPAGAFYPRPKVDSAIVRVDVEPRAPDADANQFFRVVRAGFGKKRKQLHNALAHGLGMPPVEVALLLRQSRIDSTRRAETLSIAEWERLSRAAANLESH
jgi:16S rRNA (adenine1518-N6/adenine1519-N6)-dimethyltransferase